MYSRKYAFKPAVSKYTIEDCIAVVKEFYAEFERVPNSDDIDGLHKKGKSPSFNIFRRKGGLNYVIERSELGVVNKKTVYYIPSQVRVRFRKFVSDFRSKNDGRFPNMSECIKELGIGAETFSRQTGKTYKEALLGLGASPRTSRLANQPSSAFK